MSFTLPTLDQTLAAVCHRSPTSKALVHGATEWSYARLWTESGAWVRALQSRGIGPGDVVGVMMDRSPAMIAALVAVCRSGAAFMAIDAQWPDSRVSYMLANARCRLLLVDPMLHGRASSFAVPVASAVDLQAEASPGPAPVSVDPDAVAYVIYTSGSTGQPKGVEITHRAVVLSFASGDDATRIGADEAVLQMANLGFDASQYEIWGALLNGARLVLADTTMPSLTAIADMVALHGITTLFLTTGLFHLMVEAGLAPLRSLKRLVTGGDILGVRQARQAAAALPETMIINAYGPTEATTMATRWLVPHDFVGDSVPIGTALPATGLHIVDAEMRPVPDGEVGELLLSGPRLARGYLHNPERTAESFAVLDGLRVYRTGDRVRRTENGTLEFHGRADFQLKIRGFRIEPGEVESRLREIAGVHDAIVMATANAKGDKVLAAWICTDDGASDDRALTRQLAQLLPSYMVPQHFIRMSAFPLAVNGKVDRSRLRAPLTAVPEEGRAKQPAIATGAPVDDPRLGLSVDTIIGLIAKQHPAAVAVIDATGAYSYAQLLERAAQVAGALSAEDLQADDRVAVAIVPSFAAIATQLGILLAGAAAVPLDPREAKGRLLSLVDTAAARAVIVAADDAGARETFSAHKVLAIAAGGAPAPEPATLSHNVRHLAHITFTSGSTGRPKAVAIEHHAIVHHAIGINPSLGLAPGASLLQHCAPSWDGYIFEVYATLIAGATIVVAGDTPHRNAELGSLVRRHGVSHMLMTPTLMDALDPRCFPTLTTVISGGEVLRAATVRRWANHSRVFNAYGPSEATVITTLFECDREQTAAPALGRPLPGQTVVVVDEACNPVETGFVGELLIGGANLARGYWAQPDRTEQAFTTLPWNGERFYRTGDLAVLDEQGLLHFRGRKDEQIKVNGYRIEPHEVAGTLERFPAVAHAVVYAVVVGDRPRLAAAYVLKPGASAPTVKDLRAFMLSQLPGGYVPSLYFPLADLPLLPNGKTDRKRLPQPESDASQTADADYNWQAAIVKAWCDATGQPPADEDTDFFTSGGDSLMALGMIDALAQATGTDLNIGTFMANATPRKLAAVLAGRGQPPAANEAIAWYDDARLADDVRFAPAAQLAPTTRHVLLTGATGFLGAWLLAELLARTEACVYVLVRAANPRAARQRLESRLNAAGLTAKIDWRRVRVIAGDLAKTRLGLSEFLFHALADRLDCVVHNGADVHFLKTYAQLREANVGSVHAVLGLAQRNPAIQIHYVSTAGTAGDNVHGRVLSETDTAAHTDVVGGYLQTKWVAEQLLHAAGHRGARVAIHRPGRIAPDTVTGRVHAKDLLARFAQSCAQLGAIPQLDEPFDLVPVDWVAAAMVSVILAQPATGQSYLYVNPEAPSLSAIAALCQRTGLALRLIPWPAWRALAGAAAEQDPSMPLRPLLSLFPRDELRPSAMDLPVYDCSATREVIGKLGPVAPKLTTAWLARLWGPDGESSQQGRAQIQG